MSQDSSPQEEIKAAIEQWRWSEMQGLELLSASSPPHSSLSQHPPAEASTRQSVPRKAEEMDAANTTTTSTGAGATTVTSSSLSSEQQKDGGSSSSIGGGSGEEKPKDVPAVGFGELFRFADGLDYVLMGIGSLGALVHGCSLPLFLRFFADLVNSFGSNAHDMDKMMQEVLKYAFYFLVVGAAIWASSWAEISCWMWTGERQSTKMRIKYLEAALNQDIQYFDTEVRTSDVVYAINTDAVMVQDAISEKVRGPQQQRVLHSSCCASKFISSSSCFDILCCSWGISYITWGRSCPALWWDSQPCGSWLWSLSPSSL